MKKLIYKLIFIFQINNASEYNFLKKDAARDRGLRSNTKLLLIEVLKKVTFKKKTHEM